MALSSAGRGVEVLLCSDSKKNAYPALFFFANIQMFFVLLE